MWDGAQTCRLMDAVVVVAEAPAVERQPLRRPRHKRTEEKWESHRSLKVEPKAGKHIRKGYSVKWGGIVR